MQGAKADRGRWTNRQRTLVFSSRGISYRVRHLLNDLRVLMPHSKKDAKMDRKDKIAEVIPEICELKNCNNCVYIEMRKKKDVYMWLSKVPHGPSAKFLVQNRTFLPTCIPVLSTWIGMHAVNLRGLKQAWQCPWLHSWSR